MKNSSTYPVLYNRPIDQWKVTELKEELKRRKLTIKGLKDDLVRRLDEALRNELESIKEDSFKNNLNATPENVIQNDEENDLAGTPQPLGENKDIGIFDGTPQPEANFDGTGEKVIYEKDESMKKHDNDAEVKGNSGCDSGTNKESVVLVTYVETKMGVFSGTPQTIVQTEAIGIFDGIPQPEADSDRKGKMVLCEKNESIKIDGNNAETKENSDLDSGINDEGVVLVTSEITNIMVKEVLPGKEEACDGEGTGGDDLVKNEQENSGTLNKRVTSEIAMDVQVTRLEAEVAKPPLDDVTFNSSVPDNQVSEVSSVLGFQLKTNSNSSDSVATNKKNELKDNIFDDNVNKLELDVKTEMVHPSSSNVVSDESEPHPMDVEEPCDKKKSVKERDEKNASLEISKKNDSLDLGSSEKLILDRSSGDDSMDDDNMENKPIDFSYNSGGVVDQSEKIEGSIVEEAPVAMPDDVPGDKKEIFDEIKKVTVAPFVKRKNDQEAVGNNEISKRQRRWNTGSLMVFEPQSDTTSSTMPKETLPTPMLKRNFSKLDSTTGEETPKERVVPPSLKSPTTSLRIDRFLRPFTLKAVQELLGKTGSITSFWMDHIKTHCYVTYSSVEEAVETRNAVYNLQWPPNGGRLLLAEFVDPQEVKSRSEATPPPFQATPVSTEPTLLAPPPPTAVGQPPRQQVQRQQNLQPPPSLPPPLSNPPQARERLPPPPPLEKIDTPIVTLDDLFRKTKGTPRIYYLPLTDEQVAAKRRNIKQ